MQTMPSNPRRIDSLQAVRALAFLGIVAFHSGALDSGACSVSVFFILSGFLMVYSYRDRTLPCSVRDCFSFSRKKIKKLYPLHILMICVLIVFAFATNTMITQIMGIELTAAKTLLVYLCLILTNVLLIQSWIPLRGFYLSLNVVAWYLSTAAFLYAAFPLILKRIKRSFSVKKAIALAIAVYTVQIALGLVVGGITADSFPAVGNALVSGLLAYILPLSRWFTYFFPLFRLGDFVIGCCLGYLFLHRKTVPRRIPATLAEIAAFVVIGVSVAIFTMQPRFIGDDCLRYNMLNTPGSVLLIWTFANGAGALSQILTNKPMLFLAKISSYGFLSHYPIVIMLEYLFDTVWSIRVNPWILAAVDLGLTIVFSWQYMLCEQRIRQKRTPSLPQHEKDA